jgi:hypothetical protein
VECGPVRLPVHAARPSQLHRSGGNSGASAGVAEAFTPSQDHDLTTIQIPLAWLKKATWPRIKGDKNG